MIEAKGVRDGCHFVWEIQIEAMKAGIVPEWLAKSFADYVINDEKKLKKKRERSGLKKKSKKRKRDVDSDAAEKLEESKKSSSNLSSVPRFGGENVGTEAMQAENAVPSEKSRKRRRNKAKNKKKANNEEEGSGSKAKTRKRDAFSVAADERKKGPWDLSKCSHT
jgi:hypothetical protein